ncbi:MAG TPA: phosphatase PAP2 family protein [Dehalococcoidia bacterium]|nr:phosphatase PAP2 family protein [Dehalococcoidia bacterium]
MKAVLAWRPGLRDLAEILLVGSALPLYYLVRGSAHERAGEAAVRATQLIHFERSLGIFLEADLQRLVLDYWWLVKFLNAFYLYGHLPVIGVIAVWLYFLHRPQYLLMRNAFLISGAIGLMVYVTFPVAPPRFLPEWGFVDTVLNQYDTGRPLTPAFFVNEYAAMPSLHFGWNVLVGAAVWLASRNPALRAFAVLMPIAMLADIVLTANHFFVDAAAGLGAVVLGAAIAVGVRCLVLRYWPQDGGMTARKAWLGWLHWLCGLADPPERPWGRMPQGGQS